MKNSKTCDHWQICTDTIMGTETTIVYVYVCVLCGRVNPDCTNYEGWKDEKRIRKKVMS